MKADFLGKTLLFVTAHPDDESYLASGTMHKNNRASGKSIIICATLGEKGKSHLKKDVPAAEIKRVGKQELKKVSRHLHVWKLLLLDFPDGSLRSHSSGFLNQVLTVVIKYQPNFILGFGPDGVSAHRNHVVAGAVAAKAAKQTRTPLLCFCAAAALLSNLEALAKKRRRGVYKNNISYRQPNSKIKINSRIKPAALRCHKSQLKNRDPFQHLPPKVVKEILNYEYFVE